MRDRATHLQQAADIEARRKEYQRWLEVLEDYPATPKAERAPRRRWWQFWRKR